MRKVDHNIREILETFPPSSKNNSREIVRRKLLKMRNSPNDRTAKELDRLGIVTDHDDYRDHMGEYEQSKS